VSSVGPSSPNAGKRRSPTNREGRKESEIGGCRAKLVLFTMDERVYWHQRLRRADSSFCCRQRSRISLASDRRRICYRPTSLSGTTVGRKARSGSRGLYVNCWIALARGWTADGGPKAEPESIACKRRSRAHCQRSCLALQRMRGGGPGDSSQASSHVGSVPGQATIMTMPAWMAPITPTTRARHNGHSTR
jgi:hypothetical protein